MSRWPAFMLFIAVGVWSELPAYHDDGAQYRPPVARLAQYEFTQSQTLGVVSGTWAASGGTFNSTSTTTAIATIDSYNPEFDDRPELLEINAGKLTQVATATHSALGSNVWFNVELARRGPNATVKVNNQIVFENVPTAQLDNIWDGGRIGVVSHWAPGRFDNLRFESFWTR